MSEVPIFTDAEREAISGLVLSPQFEKYGKFMLNVRDFSASNFKADQLASAYLLMNSILMTRASQKILKFVCLSGGSRDDLTSGVNILRSYLRGDFSSLGNIRTWESVLRNSADLPADILIEVERTIEFFEGSEIGDSSRSFQRAEVAIGFAANGETPEAEFIMQEDNVFLRRLNVQSGSKPVAMTEIFYGKHNVYRLGDRGKNTCIDLSLSDWQESLIEWMTNVKTILSGEFYSKA
ncbi:MAG: hypothetical protein JJ913_03655 [Rhizobiaceae bacterium]|nr:hypothetical protein [Rhizobiaceae bacterium]